MYLVDHGMTQIYTNIRLQIELMIFLGDRKQPIMKMYQSGVPRLLSLKFMKVKPCFKYSMGNFK